MFHNIRGSNDGVYCFLCYIASDYIQSYSQARVQVLSFEGVPRFFLDVLEHSTFHLLICDQLCLNITAPCDGRPSNINIKISQMLSCKYASSSHNSQHATCTGPLGHNMQSGEKLTRMLKIDDLDYISSHQFLVSLSDLD